MISVDCVCYTVIQERSINIIKIIRAFHTITYPESFVKRDRYYTFYLEFAAHMIDGQCHGNKMLAFRHAICFPGGDGSRPSGWGHLVAAGSMSRSVGWAALSHKSVRRRDSGESGQFSMSISIGSAAACWIRNDLVSAPRRKRRKAIRPTTSLQGDIE